MSAPRKQNDDNSPMAQLKRLCTEKPDIRDELFKLSDEMTSAVWRMEVKKRFGIWLSSDSQLSRWRQWAIDRIDQELLNDAMELHCSRFQEENPNATAEQVREAGMLYFMEQARARSDRKAFLDVVKVDQKERHGRTKADLERSKLELADRRVKLLEDKVRNAQALIDNAKASKGGITPETLEKIERELKLL